VTNTKGKLKFLPTKFGPTAQNIYRNI